MSSYSHEDIAVIGMSCVLPGAKDAGTFWSNILAKRNCIGDAPEEWLDGKFDEAMSEPDHVYTKKIGLLGDLADFDPLEFGIVPNSLSGTEPDHFLALKMAARALTHAGYAEKPFDRKATGIILGRGAMPNRGVANGYLNCVMVDQTMDIIDQVMPDLDASLRNRVRDSLRGSLDPLSPEVIPGIVSNVAVGRIANRLDLLGPTYMIDAACSSTLIAVELAMKELRSGQSRMMLAGGVQGSMPITVYIVFCLLNALSREAARPFAANADGTILSEGAGFLVLKRRSDAEADGDEIFALLKSVGIASDGRAQGLLAPRVEGEILAIARAYDQAEVSPESIGLVEAHGTGVPLGDRTEVEALRTVFETAIPKMPVRALGSVKSMIGHCIPAAGIASLVKTILALHYKVLPPTICDEVHPSLELEKSSFYINTETRPWIHPAGETPRRAGIDGFGFGGINSHAVLEEAPRPVESQDSGYDWPTELLLLSAETPEALVRSAQDLRNAIVQELNANLAKIAAVLAEKPRLECRLAIVASSTDDAVKKLDTAAEKIAGAKKPRLQTRTGITFDLGGSTRITGKVAFLFPGQGSQYPNMMADLCLAFPEFRNEFDLSDAAFRGMWDTLPSHCIFPPPTCLSPETANHLAEKYLSVDVSTETTFTANLAMFRFLQSLGLGCDMMLGHSSGEYAALFASGAVDVSDSQSEIELKRKLNALHHRRTPPEKMPQGSLLTVGAVDPTDLEAELARFDGRLLVAMDNCPHQKIVFGPPDDVAILAERVKQLGGVCQILPYGSAYHTHLIEPMQATLLEFYEQIPIKTPVHPLISCANLVRFPDAPAEIRSLSASQWCLPVRFRETIERLFDEEGVRFFIEIGPSAVLTAFVEDTLRKRDFVAVATNDRARPGLEHLQRTLGQLWCRGLDIDFKRFYLRRPPFVFPSPAPMRPASKANKPLNLLLPRMQLDDEVVAEIRSRHRPSVPDSGASPLPAAGVIAAHEQLMQEFLASQQRMIEGLLAGLDSRLEEE